MEHSASRRGAKPEHLQYAKQCTKCDKVRYTIDTTPNTYAVNKMQLRTRGLAGNARNELEAPTSRFTLDRDEEQPLILLLKCEHVMK